MYEFPEQYTKAAQRRQANLLSQELRHRERAALMRRIIKCIRRDRMETIKVYVSMDGKVTLRMPKGVIPDRATLERVSDIMKKQRLEVVA